MRFFNLLAAIPRSFFSRSLYQEAGETWRGRGFLYLLLFLLIYSVFLAFTSAHVIGNVVQVFGDHIAPQVPTIVFKNGVATANQTQPVIIKSVKEIPLMVIDTRVKPQSVDSMKAYIFVQRHQLVINDHDAGVRTYPYSKNANMTITPEKIKTLMMHIKSWAFGVGLFVLYFLYLGFSYVYLTMLALVFGLIALVLVNIWKRDLSYGALINLFFLAVTPALVLRLLSDALSIHQPFMVWIYLILTLFYLAFGIRANKRIAE